MEKLSDEDVERQYRIANGLDTKDIGSVKLLRAHVNEKLVARGYKKLNGYRSKKDLLAINRKY